MKLLNEILIIEVTVNHISHNNYNLVIKLEIQQYTKDLW